MQWPGQSHRQSIKKKKKITLSRLGSLDHNFAFLYVILIYYGFTSRFVFKYVAIISVLFGGLLESQRTLSEAFKTGLDSRELHTKKILCHEIWWIAVKYTKLL